MKLINAGSNLAPFQHLIMQIQQAKPIPFSSMTPASIPDSPGLYVITVEKDEVLRAGRTDLQTLRDRVYRNHLMGNQQGNLRQQLVRANYCTDLESAKDWIRQHCTVRVVEANWLSENGLDQRWAEHFILAIFQPTFSN